MVLMKTSIKILAHGKISCDHGGLKIAISFPHIQNRRVHRGISPFRRATNIPVMSIWGRLFRVSMPEWIQD